jgi:hypothetical protein
MKPVKAFLPAATIALASAIAMPASAAVLYESSLSSAAATCQLSIPTIDTVVAPRANGYRNPGTQGAFVICGVVAPADAEFNSISMVLLSLDGQSHPMSCTGVNGIPGVFAQTYATKTFTVPAGGVGLAFNPGDFGAVTPTIPGSQAFTITCNLPPQTAISYLGGGYELDIDP